MSFFRCITMFKKEVTCLFIFKRGIPVIPFLDYSDIKYQFGDGA